MSAALLKSTQEKILDSDKFEKIAASSGKIPPIFTSNDNHILDGHHRWGAVLHKDPAGDIALIQIDLPIKELLPMADKFTNKEFAEESEEELRRKEKLGDPTAREKLKVSKARGSSAEIEELKKQQGLLERIAKKTMNLAGKLDENPSDEELDRLSHEHMSNRILFINNLNIGRKLRKKVGLPFLNDLVPGSNNPLPMIIRRVAMSDLSLTEGLQEGFAEKEKPPPWMLQTIVVSKELALDEEEARKKATPYGSTKQLIETDSSYRFRQRDPELFDSDTFKTIKVEGVALVKGKFKKVVENAETSLSGNPGLNGGKPQEEEFASEKSPDEDFISEKLLPGYWGYNYVIRPLARLVGQDPESKWEIEQAKKEDAKKESFGAEDPASLGKQLSKGEELTRGEALNRLKGAIDPRSNKTFNKLLNQLVEWMDTTVRGEDVASLLQAQPPEFLKQLGTILGFSEKKKERFSEKSRRLRRQGRARKFAEKKTDDSDDREKLKQLKKEIHPLIKERADVVTKYIKAQGRSIRENKEFPNIKSKLRKQNNKLKKDIEALAPEINKLQKRLGFEVTNFLVALSADNPLNFAEGSGSIDPKTVREVMQLETDIKRIAEDIGPDNEERYLALFKNAVTQLIGHKKASGMSPMQIDLSLMKLLSGKEDIDLETEDPGLYGFFKDELDEVYREEFPQGIKGQFEEAPNKAPFALPADYLSKLGKGKDKNTEEKEVDQDALVKTTESSVGGLVKAFLKNFKNYDQAEKAVYGAKGGEKPSKPLEIGTDDYTRHSGSIEKLLPVLQRSGRTIKKKIKETSKASWYF